MRTLAALMLGLAVVVGCNGEDGDGTGGQATVEVVPDGGEADAAFAPDWAVSRHGSTTPSPASQVGTLTVEAGPTASESPPRLLLLCNVDDDDEDGACDHLNERIDGQADADDLACVWISPLPGCADRYVELRLRAANDHSFGDALRIFDAAGQPHLGRDAGTTWVLDADARAKMETQGLRLFAEGCEFAGRAELHLIVDDASSDHVLLEVAPLLLAPPSTPAETIWICGKDADLEADIQTSKTTYGRFAQAYGRAASRSPCADLSMLNVSTDPYDNDIWLQDALQWAYTETPFAYLPVAMHMPRGYPLRHWATEQLAPDVGYARPSPHPDYGALQVSLAYGGNLEAGLTPTCGELGCIVCGFESNERPLTDLSESKLAALRQFLDECTAQRALPIDTSWLSIGHVDELVSIVRSPEAPDEALLLVASPGEAIGILERVAGEPVPDDFQTQYHTLARSNASQDAGLDSTKLVWKDFLEARVSSNGPTLTQYNLDLEKRIFGDPNDPSQEAGIESLRAAVETAGDLKVELVRVPALFYRFSNAYTQFPNAASLLPNMINLVPVGKSLLVPDPLLSQFRAALADHAQIKPRFHVEWIETFDFLHLKRGGLHCVTNTRPARPTFKWWEDE